MSNTIVEDAHLRLPPLHQESTCRYGEGCGSSTRFPTRGASQRQVRVQGGGIGGNASICRVGPWTTDPKHRRPRSVSFSTDAVDVLQLRLDSEPSYKYRLCPYGDKHEIDCLQSQGYILLTLRPRYHSSYVVRSSFHQHPSWETPFLGPQDEGQFLRESISPLEPSAFPTHALL